MHFACPRFSARFFFVHRPISVALTSMDCVCEMHGKENETTDESGVDLVTHIFTTICLTSSYSVICTGTQFNDINYSQMHGVVAVARPCGSQEFDGYAKGKSRCGNRFGLPRRARERESERR